MQLTREQPPAVNVVRACAAERIRVNDQEITASVIISAERLSTGWPPRNVAELTQAHIEVALAHAPEILLLGTGASTCFPPAELTAGVLARGIGFEVMDNAAACRTYNLLIAEGRAVALALLIAERES